MKKLIGLLMAACLATPLAQAETAPAAAKKPAKKHTAKAKGAKSAKAIEPKAGKLLDDDDKEFNAGTATVTNVTCELGNKVTLYRNADDNDHMALRWNQRVHQMTRVSTSTGADRFENTRFGLVWIGIPAKGMLLDAKRGQQLANECKDADQMHPATAIVAPTEPARPADLPPPIPAPRVVPRSESSTPPGAPLTPGAAAAPTADTAPAPATAPAPEPRTETPAQPKADNKK